jgi:hypothetical protein
MYESELDTEVKLPLGLQLIEMNKSYRWEEGLLKSDKSLKF